ncbi:hypothetical protein FV218_06605 [Methylobacterium sp. WL69]|uniref:GTPase n=1 Tax=Methylobacterium sp. WL69 TaxID=2603893 RepID=UPI0011C8E437|nr:GTPase [Methylobacterium sp. WL69]TXM76609.1 hypothetical protein FV218_06605 [Methylobacterium sp. WL69]
MSGTGAEAIIPIGSEIHKYLLNTGSYEKVFKFWKLKNAYPIVVVGASGTGKTALLRSLAGLPAYVRREDRTDEVISAKAKLGELYLNIIDTPGEKEHSSKREIAFRDLMRKKSVGIINVVSHGYHEGKALLSDVVSPENQIKESFLQSRREVELGLINEWLGPLCGRGGAVQWVVTVVTKADLWWENSADQSVVRYYESEPYTLGFSQNSEVAHSVRSFSAINHLFYNRIPMSGFYSDAKKLEDRTALIAHILSKAAEHAG